MIHPLIKTVGDKSLKDCFIRDFEIAKYFSNNSNFREGVTALLINKGSSPNWSHKSLL